MRGKPAALVVQMYKWILPNKGAKRNSQSRVAYVLQRGTTALAIFGALLLSLAAPGWLVLRSLSTGLEITFNWTAILALGVPLVALTFLLVWLFLRVALWRTAHDTTFVEFETEEGRDRKAS